MARGPFAERTLLPTMRSVRKKIPEWIWHVLVIAGIAAAAALVFAYY